MKATEKKNVLLMIFLDEHRILLLLACLFFCSRFLFLSLAPFVGDEPNLQLAIDRALAAGEWPRVGLMGSFGVNYGPAALWLYLPIRLLTDSVSWIVAAHIVFQGIGLALFYLALNRALGKRTAAWALITAVASPFLFFYSRMAWDNTFLVLGTAAVAFMLTEVERNPRWLSFLLFGLSLGFCLNLHFMSLPFIAAALLVALSVAKEREAVSYLVLSMAVLLVSVAPYLLAVTVELGINSGSSLDRTPWEGAWQSALGLVRFPFFLGMEYFLDFSYSEMMQRLALPQPMGWIGLGLLLVGVSGGLSRTIHSSKLFVLAFLSAVFTFGLYAVLRPLESHPHHQMALWWIPFLLLGIGASLHWVFRLILGASVIANLVYLLVAGSYIFENQGSRGPHYGTAHSEIQRVAREICSAAQGSPETLRIDLSGVPGLLPPSLRYFLKREPGCKGKKIEFGIVAKTENHQAITIGYSASSSETARLEITQRISHLR